MVLLAEEEEPSIPAYIVGLPDRPDSDVLETVTGRGSIYAIIHREELIRRVQALIAENDLNQTVFDGMCETFQEGERRFLASIRGKSFPAFPKGTAEVR